MKIINEYDIHRAMVDDNRWVEGIETYIKRFPGREFSQNSRTIVIQTISDLILLEILRTGYDKALLLNRRS